MEEHKPAKPILPGNQGQFGENNATEAFERLEDDPRATDVPPAPTAPNAPRQTNAGERS